MRRTLGMLAVGSLLLAGAIALPSSAGAHDSWPTQYCESSHLCVWWDGDYGGSRYPFQYNNPRWSATARAPIHDDDSSSANNGTSGLRARIYRDINYESTRIVCLPRGYADGHHSPNDEGSSNIWTSTC